MKNLIRKEVCWNPMFAITENGNCYELDNIIIYNENGALIETGRGWFGNSNNSFNVGDGFEIQNGIQRKIKIDLTKKQNFVVKSSPCSYRFEQRHTLYIYYKNIDYKYEGLALDFFLNIKYSLNNKYHFTMVIGDKDKKSYKIKYSDEAEKVREFISKSYNFECKIEEYQKALKTLEKIHKKYVEATEFEKKYTIENNLHDMVRDNYIKLLENNQTLEQ